MKRKKKKSEQPRRWGGVQQNGGKKKRGDSRGKLPFSGCENKRGQKTGEKNQLY